MKVQFFLSFFLLRPPDRYVGRPQDISVLCILGRIVLL